jgi:hypothetical protein
LEAVDRSGNVEFFQTASVEVPGFELALYPNRPNPFNPDTKIEFDLPATTEVSLHVNDVAGYRIRTLVSRTMEDGLHSVMLDGRNDSGHRVSSGVYFCRLRAEKRTLTPTMVLLKLIGVNRVSNISPRLGGTPGDWRGLQRNRNGALTQ